MTDRAPAIRVSGLHKKYRATEALRGLEFTVPQGKVTGFLGPNGAGKTTTYRAMLGLTRPDSGSIEMLGGNVPDDLGSLTKRVGCIIEEPGLIKAHTGRVNLRIAADTLGFGHERIDELLDFVGLASDANRRVDGYSKGMRQRLALAAAMLGDPELLLLDEPLDGLDPAGQHVFRGRLRSLAEAGKTVVVSSHDLSDIEALADYVVVIDRGRLVVEGLLHTIIGAGGTRVLTDDGPGAVDALARAGMDAKVEDGAVVVDSDDGSAVIRALAGAGIYPSEVAPVKSSLERVFLGMTGEGSS